MTAGGQEAEELAVVEERSLLCCRKQDKGTTLGRLEDLLAEG